jgi:F-type H+-transporting ATPase subunit epsilon
VATLTVEIVSPEAALWSGPASALIARSSEGDFTILAQHTATVGDIVSTIVRVDTLDEGEIAFAVHDGFFQVGPGTGDDETLATILAGVAERTDEIDVGRAQVAKAAAEAELAELAKREPVDAFAQLAALATLERAELRIRAATH